METKGFFQFKLINILVIALSASFEYLCYGFTTMLYKYFNCFSAGTVFRRQYLTSTYKDGPCADRDTVSDGYV